jgi:hypothetical protein
MVRSPPMSDDCNRRTIWMQGCGRLPGLLMVAALTQQPPPDQMSCGRRCNFRRRVGSRQETL